MLTSRTWLGAALLVLIVVVSGCSETSTVSPPAQSALPTAASRSVAKSPSADQDPVRSVDWAKVTLPGSVCSLDHAVHLHDGRARTPAPASLHAGTADVVISTGPVIYGDLTGGGQDVAAINVWCTNTGGTVDGQLRNSWVIYSAAGSLHVLGVLVPQQPPGTSPIHVPYFDNKPSATTIGPHTITVHELWYAGADPACCPSIRATTVWTYSDGSFTPHTTRRSA